MKERLPYEKLIAEKMQDLPVPGKDAAWKKMENLLDSEMPVSLPPGRKLPGRQWWWSGAAVAAVVSAILMFQNKAPVNNPAMPPGARVQSIEKTIQQPNTKNLVNIEDKSTQSVSLNNPAKRFTGAQTQEQQNSIAAHTEKGISQTPAASILQTDAPSPDFNTLKGNSKPQGGSISILSPEEKRIEGTLQHITPGNPPPLIWYANSDNAGHIEVPERVYALPEVPVAAKKALLRTLKHRDRELERELAGSHKTSQGFWGEKTDGWLAAGITPYQNFAVASQQSFHYSSNASHNTATDYIPSPYLQWKVTSKIYLLSEFQFNAPQATPELLLSQRKFSMAGTTANYTENAYLRKLYYFNIPVSFYYSPLKNFYIGSGLQYSSFNSGLVYQEQLAPNNDIMHSEVLKIIGGPLASKIKKAEWRYLFDANYFINRLMIGFRYNQATEDYINIRTNNRDTRARNQAFQFYLRYNIVTDKRH